MATDYHSLQTAPSAGAAPGSLGDPSRALLGPRRDALLFWGAPLVALLAVQLWLRGWSMVADAQAMQVAVLGMFAVIAVTTWAHLIAVVPRAYLNREVFGTYRTRLIVAPVTLITLLLVSHTALVAAAVLAVFWDVYHSAMQNFGFARLYDMKAGNAPATLRATDLRLNMALYVGPLAAGAALAVHLGYFAKFDGTALAALTQVPGMLMAHQPVISVAATLAYLAILGWGIVDYRAAIRAGYRLPAHKLATMAATGTVSILAWGFEPPLVALATINLYHAVQYFALVWIKEGGRMTAARGGRAHHAALLFWGASIVFGLGYAAAMTGKVTIFLVPFIACSLLHFWYDSFIWSVRKRAV